MIPAPMFKHTRLTASQRAEDRACPDGAEEVERCDCGEPATVKCGREVFCCECNLQCNVDMGVRSDYAECEGCD